MLILTTNYTVDTKNKYFTVGLNRWLQLQMTLFYRELAHFIAFYSHTNLNFTIGAITDSLENSHK